MKTKAKYHIINRTDKFIYIVDCALEFQCMSVTNDAEAVVEELYKLGMLKDNQRIFYKDTVGCIDEIKHDGKGLFMGFNLLNLDENKIEDEVNDNTTESERQD